MSGTEMIALDVTDVVLVWVTALDSLIGDYSESEAFKLYNKSEDTLFFDTIDADVKYLIEDYLESTYINPLDTYLESMGYEIIRVITSDIHTTPENQVVINLILQVIPICEQLSKLDR